MHRQWHNRKASIWEKLKNWRNAIRLRSMLWKQACLAKWARSWKTSDKSMLKKSRGLKKNIGLLWQTWTINLISKWPGKNKTMLRISKVCKHSMMRRLKSMKRKRELSRVKLTIVILLLRNWKTNWIRLELSWKVSKVKSKGIKTAWQRLNESCSSLLLTIKQGLKLSKESMLIRNGSWIRV